MLHPARHSSFSARRHRRCARDRGKIGRFAQPVSVLAVALLAVASPAATGVAAGGTFAGQNGQLAFANAGQNGADIFTVDPDGSHLRRFVHTPGGHVSAYSDWSPDGHTLAFD